MALTGEDAMSKKSLVDHGDNESLLRDSSAKLKNEQPMEAPSSPEPRHSKGGKIRKTSIFGNFFSKLKSTRNTESPQNPL